jgi:acyl-CoA synthetase (AMP-forming)/AMP-acid ligase II
MTTRSSLADLFADPGSSTPAIVSTSPLMVVNYKALAEQVERLSGRLRNAGLKPGECVAIALPNSLEFLVVFLALTHARLVAVPINPADKPDEIRFFIKDARDASSRCRRGKHRCEGSHHRSWFADVATPR